MTASTMTRTTDRSMETTPSGAPAGTRGTIGAVSPWIRPWLRAEGAAVFAAGLAGFLAIGAPWYLFILLLLVPDVSAVGYLRGPRVGAIVYNLAHDLATGVVVAGIGVALGAAPLMAAARSSSRTAGWIAWPATASSSRPRSRTRTWVASAGDTDFGS